MGIRTKLTVGALAGLVFSSAAIFAQSTAQITGTISDASGGAIPGAEVKATHTATGGVRTVTTGANGAYVLTTLPIGQYTIEASKPGFSTALEAGIVLQVDANPTVDISLKVGVVNEQVA